MEDCSALESKHAANVLTCVFKVIRDYFNRRVKMCAAVGDSDRAG